MMMTIWEPSDKTVLAKLTNHGWILQQRLPHQQEMQMLITQRYESLSRPKMHTFKTASHGDCSIPVISVYGVNRGPSLLCVQIDHSINDDAIMMYDH